MLAADKKHNSYFVVYLEKLKGFFLFFVISLCLISSQLNAQELTIPILSKHRLSEDIRLNIGPEIGWAQEEIVVDAPPPPPPGAFDMRIPPNIFKDIYAFEDSTWYQWDITYQNQAGFDSLYVFFDRCELLNNVREAYITNNDSTVVFDMVSDTVAIIDPSFGSRFTVWFLSKNTISDDPPRILASLPNAVLDPNEPRPYLINVSSFFASSTGSQLRFSAQTNTDLVNFRTTETGIVELSLKEGVEDTSVVIIVTAFGEGCGFVQQTFSVDIPAIINLPIDLIQELPDFELQGNFPTRVLISNLNDYFSDKNGTQPQFAISFNASVVSISLSGNALIATSINGVFNVETTVTVTATDGEFNVSDSFLLKVGEPNRAPLKTAGIPPIEVAPNFGLLEVLYFRNHFEDPDNDRLFYTLSYDESKILASIQGDTLLIASIFGVKNERIEIDLIVSDGILATNDSFTIQIQDNLPPQISTDLADSLVLTPGFSTFTWHNLNELFLDPENDELSFTLNNQNPEFASISINNNQLVITEVIGVENQIVNHTVSAFDGVNTVSKDLEIHITEANVAPVVSPSTIEITRNYASDLVISLPLSTYFSDSNGDSLTYTFTASSNVVNLSNQSDGVINTGQELSIELVSNPATITIKPLLNTRLDEDILVKASDGEFTVELVIELNIFPEGEALPTLGSNQSGKKLYRTFPNPAVVSSTVAIVYEIPNSTNNELVFTEVNVYNILGRFVKRLVLQRQEAGVYTVNFDTNGLAAGTYIYTLRTTSGLISRKLTLID